jgi:hypothetical protein
VKDFTAMNAIYQRKIVVDGHIPEVAKTETKVQQDIDFLQNRISSMKQQPTPNHVVIVMYENMLRSRKAVLSWLHDGQHEN